MNENMRKALEALSVGEPADGRSVAALKKRGLVSEDGTLTEAGVTACGGDMGVSLTLGTPLGSVRDRQGKTNTLPKGTKLIVVFAGRDKRHQKWADCFLNSNYPLIRVLDNRMHKIVEERVNVS